MKNPYPNKNLGKTFAIYSTKCWYCHYCEEKDQQLNRNMENIKRKYPQCKMSLNVIKYSLVTLCSSEKEWGRPHHTDTEQQWGKLLSDTSKIQNSAQ